MRDGNLPLTDLLEPGAGCGEGFERVFLSMAISLRRIADLVQAERDPLIAVKVEGAPPPVQIAGIDQELWGRFTPTERMLAPYLARGLPNKQIALIVRRAEGTLRVHVNHILRKAGVKTRAALVGRLYGIDGRAS